MHPRCAYLDISAISKLSDIPNTMDTTAIENMLQIITGLRPNLSAAQPQK